MRLRCCHAWPELLLLRFVYNTFGNVAGAAVASHHSSPQPPLMQQQQPRQLRHPPSEQLHRQQLLHSCAAQRAIVGLAPLP